MHKKNVEIQGVMKNLAKMQIKCVRAWLLCRLCIFSRLNLEIFRSYKFLYFCFCNLLGKCPAGRQLDLDVCAKNDVTFESWIIFMVDIVVWCLCALMTLHLNIHNTHTHLCAYKNCLTPGTTVRIRKISKITNAAYNGERLDSYWRLTWRGKWTERTDDDFMRGNEWQFTQESSGGKKLRTDTHTEESREMPNFLTNHLCLGITKDS